MGENGWTRHHHCLLLFAVTTCPEPGVCMRDGVHKRRRTNLAPSFVSILPDHPFDSVSVKSASSESTTGLFASTHLYVITPDPRRLKYRTAFSGASTDVGSSFPQDIPPVAVVTATTGVTALGALAFWRSCTVITAPYGEWEHFSERKREIKEAEDVDGGQGDESKLRVIALPALPRSLRGRKCGLRDSTTTARLRP